MCRCLRFIVIRLGLRRCRGSNIAVMLMGSLKVECARNIFGRPNFVYLLPKMKRLEFGTLMIIGTNRIRMDALFTITRIVL